MTRVILVTGADLAAEALELLSGYDVVFTGARPSEDDIVDLCRRHDPVAIIVRYGRVGAPAIAAAPSLKVISKHGSGTDTIDKAAAGARGIAVMAAAGANAAAVAEHALALLLACAVTGTYRPEIPAWARLLFLSSPGTWLQLLMFDRFPQSAIAGLLREESTYTAKERTREANRIARDPRLLGIARQLVATFTPYDLRRAGLDNDLVQLAAIAQLPLERIRCPTLIAHGTADEVVPYASLEHAAKGLRAAGIEVETLSCPGVGHGIDQNGLVRAAEFLHKALTG